VLSGPVEEEVAPWELVMDESEKVFERLSVEMLILPEELYPVDA